MPCKKPTKSVQPTCSPSQSEDNTGNSWDKLASYSSQSIEFRVQRETLPQCIQWRLVKQNTQHQSWVPTCLWVYTFIPHICARRQTYNHISSVLLNELRDRTIILSCEVVTKRVDSIPFKRIIQGCIRHGRTISLLY